MQSLIIVSNRLPVTVGKTIEKSSGGMVSALEALEDSIDFRWVGWAGGAIDDPGRREEISRELESRFNFFPLFLNRGEADAYYTGFSNSSLWPLLHYMPTKARFRKHWFEKYREVNQRFAEAVLQHAGEADVVWIQDYHLMLLPAMLREKRPDMRIGFFLHTPFPSYEIFRCLPARREILQGLLGADLIGFHTFGYLRHFRSTVLRLLGFESEIDRIAHNSHQTHMGVYPIGINASKFSTILAGPEYAARLETYRDTYADKNIVLGVERLDYTKGVSQRLDAIERFLAQTGRRDVVFIFICVPSRENVPEYRELRQLVERKVSRINGKYSSPVSAPVHFIHRSVKPDELCALYTLADAAIVTPLMDGMNLVAKEYVFCQREKYGQLILSEFAGAAQELYNAHIVNPYDIQAIADALQEILKMPPQRRRRRLEPMQKKVARYDARFWAESFLNALAAADVNIAAEPAARPLVEETVRPLLSGGPAALFLDYDGTLAELVPKPDDAAPAGATARLLSLLQQQTQLEVFIIGGRSRQEMARWFGGRGFHLIAEHGYCCRENDSREWEVLAPDTDLSWKAQIMDFLELFAGTTPGSFLEEKTASVVWHYGSADPEYGSWKAHQLVSQLQEMLSNLPVGIHHAKKVVEIVSLDVNKGIAVSHFMNKHQYAAALCAGDDETDEAMFRLEDDRMISLKVGAEAQTAADFYIPTPARFRSFLQRMLSGGDIAGEPLLLLPVKASGQKLGIR